MSEIKDLIDFGEDLAKEFGQDTSEIDYKSNTDSKKVNEIDILVGGRVDQKTKTEQCKKFEEIHKQTGMLKHDEMKDIDKSFDEGKKSNEIVRDVKNKRNKKVDKNTENKEKIQKTTENIITEPLQETTCVVKKIEEKNETTIEKPIVDQVVKSGLEMTQEEKQKIKDDLMNTEFDPIQDLISPDLEDLSDAISFDGADLCDDNSIVIDVSNNEVEDIKEDIKEEVAQKLLEKEEIQKPLPTDGHQENVVLSTKVEHKDSKEILKEDEEVLETRYFKEQPAIVSFGQKITVNLGNFESVSFNVHVSMPVKPDPAIVKEYVLHGGGLVKQRLMNEVSDVTKYIGTDVTSKFARNPKL